MIYLRALALSTLAYAGLYGTGATAAPVPPAGSPLPALLEQALAGSGQDTADAWAYRRTLTTRTAGDLPEVVVARFDPSRTGSDRCVQTSLELGEGSEEGALEPEQPCDEPPERPLYGDLRELLEDARIELVAESSETVEYRIRPRDKRRGFRMGGVNIELDEDDGSRLMGRVLVQRGGATGPFVERVALYLDEPAGQILARVSRLEILYVYEPDAASGAKLLRSFDIGLDLKLFGLFNVSTDVQMAFDEYRLVKP